MSEGDLGQIQVALERIAHALETIARKTDPEFKTLREIRREAQNQALARRQGRAPAVPGKRA